MRDNLELIFTPRIVRHNLMVALVVGTILNVINQIDAILISGEVNFIKLGLTYCVPFFVASYGSYNALRRMA